MTDKPDTPPPVTMQSFCVSCGEHMQIVDQPANLPDSMPLQCDACVANKTPLPKGYE